MTLVTIEALTVGAQRTKNKNKDPTNDNVQNPPWYWALERTWSILAFARIDTQIKRSLRARIAVEIRVTALSGLDLSWKQGHQNFRNPSGRTNIETE